MRFRNRNDLINYEIETSVRLAHSSKHIPEPTRPFGVRQPYKLKRDHPIPDEPSILVCLYVPPPPYPKPVP